ncbi:hypothetical protein MRX96_007675 [Rhipicephalus microplus]
MSLPLLQQPRKRDPSVGVECSPKRGATEKSDSSPFKTRPTLPTNSANDEKLNDRCTAVGNAYVHLSVAESRQKEGPKVSDDMDTWETDDNKTEADNAKYIGAENRSPQWSVVAKRKPNRKVKPKQLCLARVSQPHFAL